MAAYKTINEKIVLRVADGAFLPKSDSSNKDSLVYQAWVAGGGVPDAADAPPEETTTIEEEIAAIKLRLDALEGA